MSEGIGARLRGARERSRLTIMQAAEKLHVDAEILEALEAENFAALGAPVYVKGHLRHYAELVGESAQALSDLYSQGARVPQPDLTRIPKPAPDHAGRLVGPAVVVVVVFSVAGTVWWGLSLTHRQWSTAAARPVPIVVRAAAPLAQEESPSPMSTSATAGGTVGGAASPAGLAALAPPTAARRSRPTMAVATVPAGTVARGQVGVVLAYSADSWTEVDDATGRRLLYGLATAPATRRVAGVAPLSVVLGDASDVTLEVGGHATSFSRFLRADHSARFLIAADGRLLALPRKKGG
jgi:cytoskeleton protein RodZ